MGNSSESASEVDSYNHPRLGNIKRIQQFNSSQYIGYEIIMENQKIYDEWVKEIRFIKTEESVDEILFLPLQYNFKQTAYCGTGGIASLRYEDYLYSLLPQIINRREIKRPFNEQELMYLFYSLVKISSILELKNRVVGDIKPENILVNQDGYIKIISQFSWPGQQNKFVRGWDKGNQRLLLSPQQCEERQKKKQAIIYNTQDSCSEVFSIGMTILQAGTLRDCSEIYGSTYEYKFSEVKVRELLDIFETRYTKQLSEIVREMLHPNPKRRWKAEQIYKLLKPYQFQILNLEEIAIHIDASLLTPKIEREEKISIKRMGDSHHSLLEQHMSSSDSYQYTKNSHLEASSPSMRVSPLPQPSPSNPPYISSIHFVRESNSNHRSPANVPTSTFYPEAQHNYQLVNDHSNFGRPLAPQSYNAHALKPSHYMVSSLPMKLQNLSQSNSPGQQYITQNSLILGPTQDAGYGFGNPRSQFVNY